MRHLVILSFVLALFALPATAARPVRVSVGHDWTEMSAADAAAVKVLVFETLLASGDHPSFARFKRFYPPPSCEEVARSSPFKSAAKSALVEKAAREGRCLLGEAFLRKLWFIESAEIALEEGRVATVLARLSLFDEALPQPEPEAARSEAAKERALSWRRSARCDHKEVRLDIDPGTDLARRWHGLASAIAGGRFLTYEISFGCSETPEALARAGRPPGEWNGAGASLSAAGEVLYGTAARTGEVFYVGVECRPDAARLDARGAPSAPEGPFKPTRGSNARLDLRRVPEGAADGVPTLFSDSRR